MRDSAVEKIAEFLDTIIQLSGLRLRFDILLKPSGIFVELSGEDSSLLLGKNGELLNALEYLTNKLYAPIVPEGKYISFDCMGFRNKRADELKMMARYVAQRVRYLGKSFTFEPMPPAERRIIHLELLKEPGVRTESVGEGSSRKVVVYPT
ncbi:MAG: R3H domain-containing nucleic acid-binding protein [Acidobacteriota bacterium]|nr:hypothetical protein [Blastocatellia bacterium]MDW8412501.1 R3H domain-containing nucleic acid-binding protein [Acidobacteriota bacterium]